MYVTRPINYQGFTYWIAGRPNSYVGCINAPNGRVYRIEPFTGIVEANQVIRQRIDLIKGIKLYEAS